MNRSLLRQWPLVAAIALAGGMVGWLARPAFEERIDSAARAGAGDGSPSTQSRLAGARPGHEPPGFRKSHAAAATALWSGPRLPLATMTEATWRQVVAGYGERPLDPGSERATEWRLVLAQAGKVGGQAAVEEMFQADRASGGAFTRAAEVFAGWAVQEPEAAWDWLAASEDQSLRSALLPRFVRDQPGDPTEEAIAEFSHLPPDQQSTAAAGVALNLIQSAGYEAGDALLDHMVNQASEDAESDPGSNPAVRRVFEVLAQYREEAVRNGGSLEAQCDWLATYADRSFVSSEHFALAAEQLSAQQGPATAVGWLASVTSFGEAAPADPALRDAFQHWAKQDADAASRWLAGQREHPAYDTLAAELHGGARP